MPAATDPRILVDAATRDDGAAKLFQAQLGMPKNKKLLKLLNESGVKPLVQKMELAYIADRKLPSKQQQHRDLEEALYFHRRLAEKSMPFWMASGLRSARIDGQAIRVCIATRFPLASSPAFMRTMLAGR